MKVYILTRGDDNYEESLYGVFSTVEEAKNAAKKFGCKGEWDRKLGYIASETVWTLGNFRLEGVTLNQLVVPEVNDR